MIQLDAGSYFQDSGLGVGSVNALMMESIRRFPLDVFHLGFGDLAHWNALNEAGLGARVVSTNLVPIGDRDSGPAPYLVVPVQTGAGVSVRIGFVGLTTPQRVKERSGFRALDPLRAYRKWREALLRDADFVVVLTDLRRRAQKIDEADAVYRLAGGNPEIKAIIMAEKRFVLYRPERIEQAVVVSTVDRGRYLSSLTFELDGDGKPIGSQAEAIQLGADAPDDSYWLERQNAVSVLTGAR